MVYFRFWELTEASHLVYERDNMEKDLSKNIYHKC